MHAVISLALILQTQASSTSLAYHFTVPEGFVAYPEGRATNPNIVDCWAEESSQTDPPLVLCVRRLGGTLPRDALKPGDVKPGTTLLSYRWREFDIQGFRTLAPDNTPPLFILDAHVPLRAEAVQLTLVGPPDQLDRGDTVMRATLATLEGESNWLTRSQRAERLGSVIGYALSGVVGLYVLWRIRKRQRKART